MPGTAEERSRVLAVIRALKAAGVRVKNWKNFLDGGSAADAAAAAEARKTEGFAFGRDLSLLPQRQVAEVGGSVPQFLVEACEFLSNHLHTEGLFRKTGSLARIRALRTELERVECMFSDSSALQPCDVASLLKQFLRELPRPLIPCELRGALCQAQGLEEAAAPEAVGEGPVLLLTALFPPAQVRALRYFCSFLQRVAQRSSENRMEVGSLALVIAPNLLQCPVEISRLTVSTEKQLDQQAAVIATLIKQSDNIGLVPEWVWKDSRKASGSSPPADGAAFNRRGGLNVYRSLRRQRRRSVGEMFVDALSKLKTTRTTAGSDSTSSSIQRSKSPIPKSPATVKRKTTEEPAAEGDEGSAKKRRSLHDVREDRQLVQQPGADAITLAAQEGGLTERGRRHRSQRNAVQDSRKQDRRRSLYFSSSTSGTSPSTTSEAGSSHNPQMADDHSESSGPNVPLKIPVILIDGPGRVLVATEVEDDPELLNCSFAETFDASETPELPDHQHSAVVLEGKACDTQPTQPDVSVRTPASGSAEPPCQRAWKKRHQPRRSISLPEVTVDQAEGVESGGALGSSHGLWSESGSSEEVKGKGGEEDKEEEKTKDETSKTATRLGAGLKRSQQRMSVAERLRSFNALALFMRTPRANPPSKPSTPAHRVTVRLKRQGARRFGRSNSHEDVAPGLQGEETPPETHPSPTGSYTQAEEPFVTPLSLSCPPDSLMRAMLQTTAFPQSACDDLPASGGESSPKPGLGGRGSRSCSIPEPVSDPEVEPENESISAPHLDFEPFEVLSNPEPEDSVDVLSSLLQSQCVTSSGDNTKEEFSSHTDDMCTFAHNLAFVQLPDSAACTPIASPARFCTPSDAPSTRAPSPACSPTNTPPQGEPGGSTDATPHKSSVTPALEGSIDAFSFCVEISTPTLQIRPATTKRSYRDSPRWHTPEIRMATWNPLPL
ncbi:rho GTPase-activating protein 22-like isoform X1 [Denticeps clupeoides]|uniref:rho GTPase-activating protein 22-like isoform X1 n=1 Tax=Denticeps clupeoides TaxID=299321 RepID=UPI0010A2D7DF|nr:rho GTPase-activating protein 22-like isoform X1 [Denticeps clupeoides]